MDAGIFIYFPRDPGHNIYFKVFILINCQPFPNSSDCHTKHIAVLHGLWPSIYNIRRVPVNLYI